MKIKGQEHLEILVLANFIKYMDNAIYLQPYNRMYTLDLQI